MAAARRSMADVMAEQQRAAGGPVEPLPAAAPAQSSAAASPRGDTARVPDPYEAKGAGDLDATERAHLATCEAALNGLRLAFWAAGKALQTIRDAHLYRDTHPTFEAYVEDRWEMSRPQAYRLIDAWPLAERLSPMGDKLNERQVRELLPVAVQHDVDAAVTVYQTVAQTDGVRLTAIVLKGAVAALPPTGRFDPAEAAAQIRAYLAGQLETAPPVTVDPAEVFTAEAARLRAVVSRTVSRPAFRTYAREHPDQARAVVAELRQLLDDIEAETDQDGH